MLNIGDGSAGLVYSFAVSGAVSTFVTPDFVDGYEYRLRFYGLSVSSANDIGIELYRETDASYGTFNTLWTSSAALTHSGEVVLSRVREAVKLHPINGWFGSDTSSGGWALTTISTSCVRSAQKRTRAKISIATSGNFDAGLVYMDKRINLG
jgi:hypothetical protein